MVGGAANEPSTLTVCLSAITITEILTLAAKILPEGAPKTVEDYMDKAKTDRSNASKYRRMADIVRLNDLLKEVLGG